MRNLKILAYLLFFPLILISCEPEELVVDDTAKEFNMPVEKMGDEGDQKNEIDDNI